MLTAIKAFVDDAFRHSNEELELIQYGQYQILVKDFFNFYIAVAIKGALTATLKEKTL